MALRIWTTHNDSWARISVTETPIHLDSGGPTDEGFSYTRESFWIDGPWLYVESSTTSRDCDGRLDSSYKQRAPLMTEHHLSKGPRWDRYAALAPVFETRTDKYSAPDCRGILWEPVDSAQRDYSAEAMGY